MMSKGYKKPEASEREQAAIAQARARNAKRRPRVAVKLTRKGCRLKSGSNHVDEKGWTTRILDAFGTTSPDFLTTEVARINRALDVTGEDGEARANAALAVIDGIRPRSEVESMLAGQMAVTHALAMEVLGRANRVKDIEQFDAAANAANKLLRTFAMQMEVLANMRRGGKQSMQIRHVHVHAGGQAVVGNVTSRLRAGGGGSKESVHRAHTQAITHAPVASLRGQNKEGQLVPAACDAEGTLPDARRGKG
jgi:hypothetical protein